MQSLASKHTTSRKKQKLTAVQHSSAHSRKAMFVGDFDAIMQFLGRSGATIRKAEDSMDLILQTVRAFSNRSFRKS